MKIKAAKSSSNYRPDDGLLEPKYVAYFTLYCELCMTTLKRNGSISLHRCTLLQ